VSNAAAAEAPVNEGIEGIPATTDSDVAPVTTTAADTEKKASAKVTRKTPSKPTVNDVDSGDEDELKPVPPQGLLVKAAFCILKSGRSIS